MRLRRVVWRLPDGSISLSCPANDAPLPGKTVQECLDRIAARALIADPSLAGAVRIDTGETMLSDLPSRRFRHCWRHDGVVVINMPLAREQRMGEVRKERDALLKESDHDKHRLDDIGTLQQKTALGVYRQALRDLPALAEVAMAVIADPAQLAAYNPQWPVKP